MMEEAYYSFLENPYQSGQWVTWVGRISCAHTHTHVQDAFRLWGYSKQKTIAPFCNTSPPQMILHTPTCHTTLNSSSQHVGTLLLKDNSTIKNLIPGGNNRTPVWINANGRLDGRYEWEQRNQRCSHCNSQTYSQIKLFQPFKKTQTLSCIHI